MGDTKGEEEKDNLLRRQTKFSDTENFYSDTLEKPSSSVVAAMNVPMFRSD